MLPDSRHDGMMSFYRTYIMVPVREKDKTDDSSLRKLTTRGWPDLNLPKWHAWGFNVTEIYRTPRHSVIVQPVKATISESKVDNPSFVIEGLWYRLTDELEKRLSKMMWPVLILSVMLFTFMIQAMYSNNVPLSFLMFILLYLIIEGFSAFSIKLITGSKNIWKIDIPWESLTRVVHVSRDGVILMEMKDRDERRGIAVRFKPETSEAVYSRMSDFLGNSVEMMVDSDNHLSNPPSESGN